MRFKKPLSANTTVWEMRYNFMQPAKDLIFQTRYLSSCGNLLDPNIIFILWICRKTKAERNIDPSKYRALRFRTTPTSNWSRELNISVMRLFSKIVLTLIVSKPAGFIWYIDAPKAVCVWCVITSLRGRRGRGRRFTGELEVEKETKETMHACMHVSCCCTWLPDG